VSLWINNYSVCLELTHAGQFWDAFIWEDLEMKRDQYQWYRSDTILENPHRYDRQSDLLWDELFVPLIQYLDGLPQDPTIAVLFESLSRLV
jgi:hypothetical protein